MSKPGSKKIRISVVIAVVLFVLFIVAMSIPWSYGPPGTTRIILDHTNGIYVAPPCFDQANVTNNLTESTWAKARERGYRSESTCTSEVMEPAFGTLWSRLWQATGIKASPWAW
jgi:hypothetical protein